MDKKKLTTTEIKHITKLANFFLTDKELEKLGEQLSATIQYINELKEIDTTDIPPTSNVNHLENITREDVVGPSLSQEEALKNAANTYKGYFKVKAILEEK